MSSPIATTSADDSSVVTPVKVEKPLVAPGAPLRLTLKRRLSFDSYELADSLKERRSELQARFNEAQLAKFDLLCGRLSDSMHEVADLIDTAAKFDLLDVTADDDSAEAKEEKKEEPVSE